MNIHSWIGRAARRRRARRPHASDHVRMSVAVAESAVVLVFLDRFDRSILKLFKTLFQTAEAATFGDT